MTEDIMMSSEEGGWVCRPLDSYEELLAWKPPAWRTLCEPLVEHSEWALCNADVSSVSLEPLTEAQSFCHVERRQDTPPRRPRRDLSRTLLCHDMANGYHDDSHIDGTTKYDAYTFCDWSGIDIFCYFSHHFITIPPLGWINVGHMNGVKVIGTVITEWAEGTAVWDMLLSSEEVSDTFASVLVSIAVTLKFDGWLLNIENKVSEPARLAAWVRRLHELLHETLPHATLVWYDSVTAAGQLDWQNELNDNNRVFFDACDGIFTNYSWQPEQLAATATAAGVRRHDVYVGCDVWGRNFFGGGQFNTGAAVSAARAAGLSVALFAAAWSYEAAQDPSQGVRCAAPLNSLERCVLRDRALWGALWGALHTHLPCRLPFSTAFCRGQGPRRRMYGEVVSVSPWYNLRHQQYQPNSRLGPHGLRLTKIQRRPRSTTNPTSKKDPKDTPDALKAPDAAPDASKDTPKDTIDTEVKYNVQRYELSCMAGERPCLEAYDGDSYIGGGCLKLNPSDESSRSARIMRLFHCDFFMEDALVVCVVTKPVPPHCRDQYVNVELVGTDASEKELRVVLVGYKRGERPEDAPCGARLVYPCGGGELCNVQRYLVVHRPDVYVPIENRCGWQVRYYNVVAPGSRVLSILLHCGSSHGALLLGYLALADRVENPEKNVVEEDNSHRLNL